MKRKSWYETYIQGSSVSKRFQYYFRHFLLEIQFYFYSIFFIFIFYNENRITSWNSIIQWKHNRHTHITQSMIWVFKTKFPIEIAHLNGWSIHWIRKTGRLISWLNNMIYKHLNDSFNALFFLPSSFSCAFEIGWRIFGWVI